MTDYPTQPEPQHQPSPPPQAGPGNKGKGGAVALLIVGIVLLLCGCGSVVGGMNSASEVGSAGDPVAMATVLVLKLGILIGGLACIVLGALKLRR